MDFSEISSECVCARDTRVQMRSPSDTATSDVQKLDPSQVSDVCPDLQKNSPIPSFKNKRENHHSETWDGSRLCRGGPTYNKLDPSQVSDMCPDLQQTVPSQVSKLSPKTTILKLGIGLVCVEGARPTKTRPIQKFQICAPTYKNQPHHKF